MKNLVLFFAVLSFSIFSTEAQYVLDFSDPSTYSVTCGSVNPAQWSVSNECCSLLIRDLIVADPLLTDVPVSVTVNQSGNMEHDDSLVIKHRVNYGIWVIDTILYGDVATAVRQIDFTLHLNYLDTLDLMVIAENDASNEFWSIKSGEISADNVTPKSSLPVDLTYFDAEYISQDESVKLSWATASETNNSHFVISRSVNTVDFEDIGWVMGAGNSSSMNYYEFSDYELPDAPVVFYRLTQYDFDGKTSVKEMVAVSTESGFENVEIESGDNIFIANMNVPVNQVSTMTIINMQGQVVYQTTISFDKCTVIVDAELKPMQVYILRISSETSTQCTKLLAQ